MNRENLGNPLREAFVRLELGGGEGQQIGCEEKKGETCKCMGRKNDVERIQYAGKENENED